MEYGLSTTVLSLSLYLVLVFLQMLRSLFMLKRGRNIYLIASSNLIRSKVLCFSMSVEDFYNFPSGQTTKNSFWKRYITKKIYLFYKRFYLFETFYKVS